MIVTEDGDVTITAGRNSVEASHHAGQEFYGDIISALKTIGTKNYPCLEKLNITGDSGRCFAMTPTVSAARSPSWNRVNILNSAPPRRLNPLMRFSTAVAKF